MSKPTRLLVVRHGETDWNRQQRFQGQIDVPLNATGLAQARRLAERLAADPAERLFCSDLLRTRQTAEPLAQAWGLQPEAHAGLREQGFGVLEGLDVPTIQAQHAGLWTQWLEHRGDFALPGGESLQRFHARVMATLQELADAHPGRSLALVTHGGVLDMLWRSARGEPIEGLRRCEIPNTGINRLSWADGRLQIELWGDAAHLQGLPEQPPTKLAER